MGKSKIEKLYTSRTIQKILKKYIAQDQEKINKRMTIISQITTAMEAKGINQKELALMVRKRPKEIARILAGKQDISGELVDRFKIALGMGD